MIPILAFASSAGIESNQRILTYKVYVNAPSGQYKYILNLLQIFVKHIMQNN